MNKAVRVLLALCALTAVVAVAAGCGGGSVPGNAVASVNGDSIDKSEFTHWMNVAVKSSGQKNATVPDPPDYAKCVAAKRKTTPQPGKGQPKVTDAALKKQCQQEYTSLRDQVVSLLISYRWIQGEADKRGIKVTDAEVKKSFEAQKKQNFPKEADYQKFLKQYGQTEADILTRVKLDLLSNKIRDQVIKGKNKVTDAQIQSYYNAHKSTFSTPETRDLLIVLTKKKPQAEQARKAIQGGQPWAKVAKKFSIDQASKSKGGKLPGQAKGSLEQTLNTAVFSAKAGQLVGPIKTQFGWYDFKVTKINTGKTQPLDQAKATIRQTLISQNQQKALSAFVTRFRNEWRAKTECRKGYVTSDCKNGPKPTPTPTTAAPVPQG
jgi:foldase protein PrsA